MTEATQEQQHRIYEHLNRCFKRTSEDTDILIQEIYIEYLLLASHCAKGWKYCRENNMYTSDVTDDVITKKSLQQLSDSDMSSFNEGGMGRQKYDPNGFKRD